MPSPKESGELAEYVLRHGPDDRDPARNLARAYLDLVAERDALREALVKLADYKSIVTPCEDRLCVECRTARVARAALERTP
jgi:hypothetical protein